MQVVKDGKPIKSKSLSNRGAQARHFLGGIPRGIIYIYIYKVYKKNPREAGGKSFQIEGIWDPKTRFAYRRCSEASHLLSCSLSSSSCSTISAPLFRSRHLFSTLLTTSHFLSTVLNDCTLCPPLRSKLLHRGAFKQSKLLHRASFYTEQLLHRETFTDKKFLHRESSYTEKLLHRETFDTDRGAFTQSKVLHWQPFAQRSFYAEKLLRRSFHMEKLLHREAFTQRSFYAEKLLHKASFYTMKL